jgi:hypothetical protein
MWASKQSILTRLYTESFERLRFKRMYKVRLQGLSWTRVNVVIQDIMIIEWQIVECSPGFSKVQVQL